MQKGVAEVLDFIEAKPGQNSGVATEVFTYSQTGTNGPSKKRCPLPFRDDFSPSDEILVFYASELLFLRQMTPDELRRRYAEKRALGGGWIRDRIDEPRKD